MAATTDSFRSSLHGFNRMDVVQFIQKTTSEHELELRRLAEERTRQQEELEQQKKELAARQEESERQKQELSQLRAELAELREQNAALRQAQEPAEQPAAAVQKPRYDEMELTAYRRAEQTERMARERAAASAVRMRSAFEQADVGTFDLILMDIMMPNMNGYEATRAIRSLSREDARTIPIVAMSANAFTEDKVRCREAGMDGHLTKPIDSDKLIDALSKIMAAKEK